MNGDLRQYVLLTIAVLAPAIMLLNGRRQALLVWVCATIFIQIFDTGLVTNLPAGRIVGLMCVPLCIGMSGKWIKITAARAWMLNFAYLIVLGILWGYLWPWPDLTNNRPFALTAPGRAPVYLIRILSDVSLTIFVASELVKSGGLKALSSGTLFGSTVTAIGGVLSLATGLDFYQLITGNGLAANVVGRARGFSAEPRLLGLACVYGIMMLIVQARRGPGWLPLLLINGLGLACSGSTSAMALFVMGLASVFVFLSNRERWALVAVVLAGMLAISIVSYFLAEHVEYIVAEIVGRLDATERLGGAVASNWGEQIAFKLDVFDSSAVLFLYDQPWYALSGTGPGLITLPASAYVPPGVYSLIWSYDVGIDSLPTHGPLLEVANSGFVGLALWIVQGYSQLRALKSFSKSRDPDVAKQWRFAHAMYVLALVFYVVQISISPVWAVMSGIGWAACMKRAERKPLALTVAGGQARPLAPRRFTPTAKPALEGTSI